MPVTLPTEPAPEDIGWVPVDFGGTLQGPLGGRAQRVNRLGNRWAMRVEIPKMSVEDGLIWSAALVRAVQSGALYQVRQPGLDIGTPGMPLVNGANQAGSVLIADGFTAGYEMVAGQFFSIIVSGRRYLHQIAADVTASGGGAATLAITPALRVSPADNAVLEFAQPYIEGLLGDLPSWFFRTGRIARGFAFTIEEVF